MKKKNFLFYGFQNIANEKIVGVALIDATLADLNHLVDTGKGGNLDALLTDVKKEITFILKEGSEVKRTCRICCVERPLRSDSSVSENCLKIFIHYYTNKEKVFAGLKINTQYADLPTPKNDIYAADSIMELKQLSEQSSKKQKAGVVKKKEELIA